MRKPHIQTSDISTVVPVLQPVVYTYGKHVMSNDMPHACSMHGLWSDVAIFVLSTSPVSL